ncbi:9920_t:CDS:2 [Paraglomus occultum]|uniref:Sugar phosphate phosphatase n=1 Tax=Paraglomus occultum TaxID=144539 RepID=A0A9N8WK62_9GLOM|nr:9920_t:CDS:2 [Paraglomus occultum]
MSSINPANPPRPALIATDKTGFAYTTTRIRWPVIVTKIIDALFQVCHALDDDEKRTEGKAIISSIGALKYGMERDKPLTPIADDSNPDIATWNNIYNTYFSSSTWYTAPWLFTECYLYRRIYTYFARSTYWNTYDPFCQQKEAAFKASQVAMLALAERIDELISSEGLRLDHRIVFHELVQISLWGNASDLSLLSTLDPRELGKLQSTGAEELEKIEKNILRNDIDLFWHRIKDSKGSRIDFVLDNAGFELYADLIFADWLIQSGYASSVHFHAKPIPWFVSDTTPTDFYNLLSALTSNLLNQPSQSLITKLAQRWQGYVDSNIWIVKADYFWVSPYAYWHLPEQKELFDDIKQAASVVFKGDLNFRKLVYDCKWDFTTPFEEAIGPMATEEGVPSVVTLRTSKADVIVGLPKGTAERLYAVEDDWLYSGKYAIVEFSRGTK